MHMNPVYSFAASRQFSVTVRVRCLCALVGILLLAAPVAYAQDAMAERRDQFGSTLARGDFNGDGYEDLAIGIPWESVTNTPFAPIPSAGAVEVIYGTASGLESANRQLWHQGALGLEDAAETGDLFGAALAAGDFNGDGFDDLFFTAPTDPSRAPAESM